MKRVIELFAIPAGLVLSLLPLSASAHSVTVDGLDGDWMTARTPANFNLGMITRDPVGHGEYVWLDVPDDGRTDINDPEFGADLLLVRVTGDDSGLAILVKTAATAPDPQVQIQVAIDLDRISGSGQLWMAGLSDTMVVADAYWEYLVQTRFTSGNDDARVLDDSFAQVDTVSADAATDNIEIYVPWSSIGLVGPPETPVRFSICSFRAESNDDVIDIGGENISDALDCVTTYGDPQSSAPYPNTWDDLADQTIHYFFDVFFAPSGEVYAPLVVQSFAANNALGSGGEVNVVRNVSPASIALDGFKLGDEEAPDSGEGMLYFPAGATLAADDVYVVAQNGSNFVTAFGWQPDAELAGGTVAPDMTTAYSVWGNTALALNNTGDHVMILDQSDTILDLVVYESGTYSGINPLAPTPTAGQFFARNSIGRDIDDCDADFQLVGFDECTGTGDCVECWVCIASSCVVVPDETGCSDGDSCTVGETCQSGSCTGGTAKDCSAQDDQCNDGVCNPDDGACIKSPANEGEGCSDGDNCTTGETCQSGSCTGGTAKDCSAQDDQCNDGVCNPDNGSCVKSPTNEGEGCSDGDNCTVGDQCVSGSCTGTAKDCSAQDDQCNDGVCNPDNGACIKSPANEGEGCSDGDNCTVGETCQSGSCTGGTAKDCSAQDDQCNDGVCNPDNGNCVKSPANENGSCDDESVCTTDDRCNSGVCAGTPTVDCDDDDPCTLDLCAADTGVCYHSDIDDCCIDDDDCDDGDPCTEDTCSEAGGSCSNDLIAGCPGSDAAIADDGGAGDAGAADGGGEGPVDASVVDGGGEGPGGSDAASGSGGDGGSGGSAGTGGSAGSGETAGSDGQYAADDAGTVADDGAGDSESGCGCAVVGSDAAGSRRPGLSCLLALFCAALLGRARRGRSPGA